MTCFARYASAWQRGIPYQELLNHAREHMDLMARAEDSGSEGCYCEVARWNPKTDRWERYAFKKFFGGEHPSEDPDAPEVSCYLTGELFAREINDAAHGAHHALIHHMPNWGE